MIIDTLKNAHKYFGLHPLFEKAFAYIQQTDLANAEGTVVVESEKLIALYSNKEGKTIADALAKFECHNKNIDIQLCISGIETIGWKPRERCTQPKGEYNSEKDVLFYNDTPDTFFQLQSGQFAIFYPEDVHAPMISQGLIKKLVIKVTRI